jgi:demethylmenaquinone methyltransferase/2-methoxy-6-polyprenyl-1,4-benzoquinol methylase
MEETVRSVFESIQDKYDFLDSMISFGLDQYWRKKMVRLLELRDGMHLLDCGAGTGKLTSAVSEKCPTCVMTSLDITEKMFRKSLSGRTSFVVGSAEKLPFPDSSMDRIMSAFLTRNLSSQKNYFDETFRVLKNGGLFVNMDIYKPVMPVYREFFSAYFFHIVPFIGDRMTHSGSYTYLANSVIRFRSPEEISALITGSGMQVERVMKLMLGSVVIHVGRKG